MSITTANARVKFGKWNGELLTRIPVSYLRWGVINQVEAPQPLPDSRPVPLTVPFHEAATLELERRGERLQDVEISAHAVDRFTQHSELWAAYEKHREENMHAQFPEGLYSFLERCVDYLVHMDAQLGRAMEECRTNPPEKPREYKTAYLGVQWVIRVDLALPVLLTAMPSN